MSLLSFLSDILLEIALAERALLDLFDLVIEQGNYIPMGAGIAPYIEHVYVYIG